MKRKLIAKIVLLFLCVIFIGVTHSQGQDHKVSGTVTNAENGGSLGGVTVTVVESSKQTITDANGKYSLSIPSGKATIIFTYVGFDSKSIEVNNRSVINVAMVTNAK